MTAALARVVPALPRLTPGWTRTSDVVVVGSGAAGLMTAVALADAGRSVTVVTKGALGDGSTTWAQGGLAAVLGADDDAAEARGHVTHRPATACRWRPWPRPPRAPGRRSPGRR